MLSSNLSCLFHLYIFYWAEIFNSSINMMTSVQSGQINWYEQMREGMTKISKTALFCSCWVKTWKVTAHRKSCRNEDILDSSFSRWTKHCGIHTDFFFQFCFNYDVIVTVMYYRNYLFPNMKFDFWQKFWGSNVQLSWKGNVWEFSRLIGYSWTWMANETWQFL